MQQKVDLNALRALSSRLKQTDSNLEQQISEMQRALKALLSRVRSDYPERYVHTAIENVEGNLQEVWKLAVRISERLSKQSDHLNWSEEHYLRTERLLKSLHIQNPFRPAVQAASFTTKSRFTESTDTANPPTKGYQLSASGPLLNRLKQLWWNFYDGLLLKKLGDYQQGDPRILSFIQIIEKGTPTEQREAREKLSVILGAFQEIARSQAAYNVYKQFGNERNTIAALKNADEQRRVLANLGVSKEWYASSVDLSKQYQNSPLSACTYNPLQDGAGMPTEAELRLAITISLENESYREWAKMKYTDIEMSVKKAEAAREIERQIAEYKRLYDPPTELPDGTLITPDNKENETTYDYFLEHIYDPNRVNANLLVEYDSWLNDTYGKTEWRKKVELIDRVSYEFVGSVIKETVMGGVDTAKFAFKLVMDPQQTTQEMLDSAAYLAKNPEVLVQAAKTVYKNFDEGTPEERAKMLGSVASLLVPGVSITKLGKANQVTGGLQDAYKLIDNVQDVNKVAERTKSLADMFPFTSVVTPEGLRMIVPKEFPGQVHRVEVPEGSHGVGIEVMGEVDTPPAFMQTEFASSYESRLNQTPSSNNKTVSFEGQRGETKCILKPPPDPELKKILDEAGIDGINFKNGVPDFSPVAKAQLEIDHMVGGVGSNGTKARAANFKQADIKLAEQLNNSPELASQFGLTPGKIKAGDIADIREELKLTWHELNDGKTIQLVPSEINSKFGHLGGVGEINAGAFEPGGFANN